VYGIVSLPVSPEKINARKTTYTFTYLEKK